MRYSKEENAILVGLMPHGLTDVTITLLDLNNDELIEIEDNTVKESTVMEGVYLWDTINIKSVYTSTYKNLLYKMSGLDASGKRYDYYGKFVYSGYVDENDVDLSPLEENDASILRLVRMINARI